MSQHATAHPTDAPVRYGSRYRSEPSTARPEPRCLVCPTSLPSRRARYCSDACKQRAYRLRRIDVTATDAALLATELKRLGELVAHTIYECPDCGERFMAEQRCPDCHRFASSAWVAVARTASNRCCSPSSSASQPSVDRPTDPTSPERMVRSSCRTHLAHETCT
jgi:hypothetical protein